jgi:hypothetical protein
MRIATIVLLALTRCGGEVVVDTARGGAGGDAFEPIPGERLPCLGCGYAYNGGPPFGRSTVCPSSLEQYDNMRACACAACPADLECSNLCDEPGGPLSTKCEPCARAACPAEVEACLAVMTCNESGGFCD